MKKIMILLLLLFFLACAKQRREPLKIEIIEPTVIIKENRTPEI